MRRDRGRAARAEHIQGKRGKAGQVECPLGRGAGARASTTSWRMSSKWGLSAVIGAGARQALRAGGAVEGVAQGMRLGERRENSRARALVVCDVALLAGEEAGRSRKWESGW